MLSIVTILMVKLIVNSTQVKPINILNNRLLPIIGLYKPQHKNVAINVQYKQTYPYHHIPYPISHIISIIFIFNAHLSTDSNNSRINTHIPQYVKLFTVYTVGGVIPVSKVLKYVSDTYDRSQFLNWVLQINVTFKIMYAQII